MALFRTLLIRFAAIFCWRRASTRAAAATPNDTYTADEIVTAGHRFFGEISGSLATLVERSVSRYGLPNGYIIGQEGSGAIIGGLRYGDGVLYTKIEGQQAGLLAGPVDRLGFRRRRQPHHDAGLRPAEFARHLPPLWRASTAPPIWSAGSA